MTWFDNGSSKAKTFNLHGRQIKVSLKTLVNDQKTSKALMDEIDVRMAPGGGIYDEVEKLHGAMFSILKENHALRENLKSVQERCTVLINTARAWRKKLIELGQSDPGLP